MARSRRCRSKFGEPDAALTAYAVSFLEDADGYIAVDSSVLDRARIWLRGQQNQQGFRSESLSLRALARGAHHQVDALATLTALAQKAGQQDDPYAIAEFALAAMDFNHPELARSAIERLRTLSHSDSDGVSWYLRANTPYHGWGRAGQIETTALALTALSRWNRLSGADPELKALIDQSALFLLRSKDQYGSWLSSQATVQVLFALLETMSSGESNAPFPSRLVGDGVTVAQVLIPAGHTIQGPVTVDISRFVKPGIANEVFVSAPPGQAVTQVQFTASWYQPWAGARTSKDLAMTAKFSATEAAPGDPVFCDVAISRPSWRGFGMAIAEVGLPPGAEVDRGTLDDVMRDAKAGVDSVEVAPDHIVFYVWPRANDSKFRFTFRPRYPIHARSAPSVVYDYYNPDARVVLPPQLFSVR